jgi:2-C-methyl-D-erythritol 4-phosphate cytidylyltransferase
MRVTAIVPAAGRGTRLGSTIPKQFIALDGKPILIYSLKILDEIEEINEIIVSAQASEINTILKLIQDFDIKKVVDVIEGGEERIQSVRNAFNRIGSTDYVLIHDSVRPFITKGIIKDVLMSGMSYGAAISAIPVTDTVKFADNKGIIVKNINRRGLWFAQTPQVFKYSILAEAYKMYDVHHADITDESGLVEQLGVKVRTVAGSIFNIKITKEEDLILAQLIVRMP